MPGGRGANTEDNKRALFVITNSFVKFKFVELSEEFESRLFTSFDIESILGVEYFTYFLSTDLKSY